MGKELSMMEARSRLTQLPELFKKSPELKAMAVTRRGKPVLAVMDWELYESILETLEILSDEELAASLKRGIQDAKSEKIASWEAVKKRLKF